MEKETIKALAETTARATAAALVGNAKMSGNTERVNYEGYTLHINKYVDDKGNVSYFSVDVVDPTGRHVLSEQKPTFSAAKEIGKKIAETHKLRR